MLTDKPWRLDALAQLGLALFVSMASGMLIAGLWVGREEASVTVLIIGALSFHGAALPCLWWFVRVHGLSWSEAFGFGAPDPARAVLLTLGVTVLALPFAWFLGWGSGEVMKLVHVTPVPQKAVTLVQDTVAVGPQIFLAGMAVVLAPVAEELLFRGVLYPALRPQTVLRWTSLLGAARRSPELESPPIPGDSRTPPPSGWWTWARAPRPWAAALIASALFGSIHLNVMTFVPLTFFGLVLTWLYERTGNLLAPILSHSLFNLANFFFLVLGRADP